MLSNVHTPAALLLAVISTQSVAANLIQNGSFESPVQRPGGYTLFAPGTAFDHWTVVGASGNVAPISGQYAGGGATFPAQDGAQWLDLTGLTNTPTGVQQAVATVPGTSYDLTFWVGNVVGGGWGTSSSVEVDVNGKSVDVATNSAGAGQNTQVWQRFALNFVATGPSTTIAFVNRDPRNDNTDGLDNVVLVTHEETVAACSQQGAGKKHKQKTDPLTALAALANGVAAASHATGNQADKASQGLNAMTTGTPVAATGAASSYYCESVASGGTPQLMASNASPQSAGSTAAAGTGTAATLAAAGGASTGGTPAGAAGGACCTPEVTQKLAVAAQSVEVAGVKLGMPAKPVLEVLKASNPAFKIAVQRTSNWDLAAGLTNDATTDPKKQWPTSITADSPDGKESIVVGFALPPNQPVALTINRTLNFPPQAQPTAANLLASLRKKYGPESLGPETVPAYAMPGNFTLFWFYDNSGRALPSSAPLVRKSVNASQCEPVDGYSPDFARFSNPNIAHGQLMPRVGAVTTGCFNAIVVRARLSCNSAGGTVCEYLNLVAVDYPLLDNAEAATDAWIDQQRRGAADRKKAQAETVDVPL